MWARLRRGQGRLDGLAGAVANRRLATAPAAMSDATWEALGVGRRVADDLRRAGVRAPSHVQDLSIPAIARGERDVVVTAETGSGKTLAYLVPIAMRAEQAGFQPGLHPLAIVLVPSKELVQQVCAMLSRQLPSLAPHLRPILGATGPSRSDRYLVAVGTPRAVLDVRGIMPGPECAGGKGSDRARVWW
jgi:superfamily II DNA/RNA helicase